MRSVQFVRGDLSILGRRLDAGWHPYALGIAAVAVALAATALLIPLTDESLISPLVGTVVFVAVYLGIGPALLAAAVGWLAFLFVFVEPHWQIRGASVSDTSRWAVGLGVALALIWVSWTLARLRRRETDRADRAEETSAVAHGLNELAAALTSAATPGEVAAALLSRVPALLGATGGSLGLVDGDRLAIVDPSRGPRPALEPGSSLPLATRAPITTAARSGEIAYAVDRKEFERDFPDGARMAGYAAGALALPLRVEGRVAGAIGFPFAQPNAIDENVISLARMAAELGGQTLERALAYERERAARDGLDRVARLMPSFADKAQDAVMEAICTEACEMFDCDAAQLWRLADGRLEVLWREPPVADAPPGHVADPADYPGMARSLEELDITFFPDARTTVTGKALDRVLAEGVRSVMRVPIVVGSRAELLLALRWSRMVPEPTAQLLALARRFADHAGLVVEQGERRRAEDTAQIARARAERLASDLAQLHALATALGAASTPTEVAALVAERVVAVVGAQHAAVYDVDGERIERLAASSVTVDDGAEADVPSAGDPELAGVAVADGARWIDEEENEARGARALVPLVAEGRLIGVLTVGFRRGRIPDPSTRRLVETIAGHTAQPLERARLHAQEHAARVEAEVSARRTRRLQALTAGFSSALAPGEVAAAFLEETLDAVGATAAALATIDEEGRLLTVVGSRRFPEALLGDEGVVPMAASSPAAATVREQRPLYYDDLATLVTDYPDLDESLGQAGLGSYAFLPVSAGAAPLAVAALAWSQPGRLVDDERAFLEAVAAQCGLALDRALRYEGERVVAETLQRSILPETLPAMEGVRVSAVYLPGSTAVDVGGDWFDILTLPDGRLGFVVGDVVGKGVQAAATMAQLRNGMRAITLDALTPAQTVTKLNLLLETYIDVPFATLAYIALDPATGEVTVSSAGHPPPLVVCPDARTVWLEGEGGLPLGVDAGTPYGERTTTLEAGSTIVLYTDGLVERRGRSIDEGLADLARVASEAPREPDAIVDALVEQLVGSQTRHDDVAVLAVQLDPVLLAPFALALPSEPASLPMLRTELERWLEDASIPSADARDILLATWEAGANAIEHAEAGRGALVHVDAALSGDRVRIGVADHGRWKEPRPRHDRGLGLRLIESLMATVDVERSGDGTRVVMERPLTREPARGPWSNSG